MTKRRVHQLAVVIIPVLLSIGCDNPVEPVVVEPSHRVKQSASTNAKDRDPLAEPYSQPTIEYWCEPPADKLDWENQKHHC